MSEKIEQEYVIMEAEKIDSSDKYFSARPQIDSGDRRNVFEAGFERGYKAGRAALIVETQCEHVYGTQTASFNGPFHAVCLKCGHLPSPTPQGEQSNGPS